MRRRRSGSRRELPLDRAALLACGVITGFGAVVNTARVEPGASVVVIGTGGVGLNAVQGAVHAGATTIVAIDLADAKLETARAFGATHTVNPGSEDAVAAVLALTGGRGADYVIVTVGAPAAVEQGQLLLRRAGTMVIVGMPASGVLATIDPGTIANDGQRILGSKMGSAQIQADIPKLVELYQDGRLKLDELISARYPFSRDQRGDRRIERRLGDPQRDRLLKGWRHEDHRARDVRRRQPAAPLRRPLLHLPQARPPTTASRASARSTARPSGRTLVARMIEDVCDAPRDRRRPVPHRAALARRLRPRLLAAGPTSRCSAS